MLKVLSTKLAVDEVDRFRAAAEQQGLSKAGLLKNLVEEYLGGSNEESILVVVMRKTRHQVIINWEIAHL